MGAGPYENYRYPREQCVKGGCNRSKQARRDRYGRFMPNAHDLPIPDKHGQAGGRARAAKAKRDTRGRFIKA